MSEGVRSLLRVLLPLLVLGAGAGVAVVLVKTRPEAKKQQRNDLGAVVEIKTAARAEHAIAVRAHGAVIPARAVVLTAEVGGRVTWINKALVPGGRLEAGTPAIRIDDRDYELAVKQSFAAVAGARTALEIERGMKKIAEREWELLGNPQGEGSALALRVPQGNSATIAVESADSAYHRAKLAVARTTVAVPFNALVQDKKVDIGQLVGPQVPVATLVGTDAYWVQASLPLDRLSSIRIPDVKGAKEGSAVRIWQDLGSERIERSGTVVRLLGDVDPAGRMARVLIEIRDPLNLSAKSREPMEVLGERRRQPLSELPLLLGAYVNVEIAGDHTVDAVEVPREAIHDGDRVYVMASDGTLAIRSVTVEWRRPDTVLVSAGVDAGDRVIVSPLPAPIEGMKLRDRDAMAQATPPPAREPAVPSVPAGATKGASAKPVAGSAAENRTATSVVTP